MKPFNHQRHLLSTGVELDVWAIGNPANPPILFLHGFPESHRTWRHQMVALSDRYYCIAPDQRGYARSSKPSKVSDYAVSKLIADVFAVANAFDLDRFTLAAHDWGGAVGWAAAIADQYRVKRLIIANAPHPYVYQKTLLTDPAQREGAQYIRNFREDSFVDLIEERGMEWFFDTSFMRHLDDSKVSADDRAAYLEEWNQPGAMRAMLNWYRASPINVPAMDEDVASTDFLDAPFPKLTMPVLVVWGMEDRALRPSQLEGLDEHVDDLTITRIEDAGHFSPWEAPKAVTKAMSDWMATR